jgi:2-aminobenzoate-CoA ligase
MEDRVRPTTSPHRLHLRHHRRAQGHDALPPRRAGDLRHFPATCCSRTDDVFIGSPPLAFTFGLGGLLLFPMRVGAASVLLEQAPPPNLLEAIARFRATVCFTAPTAYRAMLGHARRTTTSRRCASACRPARRCRARRSRPGKEATGISIIDGIGATEMLHIFISPRPTRTSARLHRPPVPGYEARVVDEEGREVPPGTVGRLAVRGPTGCRYLADERQRNTCRTAGTSPATAT